MTLGVARRVAVLPMVNPRSITPSRRTRTQKTKIVGTRTMLQNQLMDSIPVLAL